MLPFKFCITYRNKKYEWARCPFDRWNAGWEVLKAAGIWAEDNTMTTTCLRGDEDIITTTVGPTTTPGPTTQAKMIINNMSNFSCFTLISTFT